VHHQYEGWYEDTLSLRNDPGKWETTKRNIQPQNVFKLIYSTARQLWWSSAKTKQIF